MKVKLEDLNDFQKQLLNEFLDTVKTGNPNLLSNVKSVVFTAEESYAVFADDQVSRVKPIREKLRIPKAWLFTFIENL